MAKHDQRRIGDASDDLPEPGDLRRAAKHLARAERILYRAQPMSAVQLRGMIKQLKNRAKLLEATK